jgi:hypothetical protein
MILLCIVNNPLLHQHQLQSFGIPFPSPYCSNRTQVDLALSQHSQLSSAEMSLQQRFDQLSIHSPIYIVLFTVALLLLPFVVTRIPRHERRVYVNSFTGRYVIKESYWNIVMPYLIPVENRSFTSFKEFPAPSCRPFMLDPPRVDFCSSDGIPGYADVHLEMTVQDWTATDLDEAGGASFERRAIEVINSWLIQSISNIKAKDLMNYAWVQQQLNTKESLQKLDTELTPYKFKTLRIFIDSNGINLSSEFITTINSKIRLESEASLQSIEASTLLAKAKGAANVQEVQYTAENVERLSRADTFAIMYNKLHNTGMPAPEVVKLLIADRLAESLEKNQNSVAVTKLPIQDLLFNKEPL